MNGDLETPSNTLALPMPRWPFLWPVLALLLYAVNGAFHLVRNWHGTPWQVAGSVLILLLWLAAGASMAVGSLASRWRELSLENGQIRLRPAIEGIPRWALWCFNPQASRAFREGRLEIPLAGASLEWVGKSLLLHGHSETEVRLGRGERAERIARWLTAHGMPEPVGR
jgi:hypothetical protein